jgi:signal transduction histidine kinase
MTEMELRLTRLEVETALSAAHALESAIEERFGHMAHDFKTPLNAILGYSQLAGTTQDPETLTRYVHTIQEAGQHLLDLVTNTLDVVRAHAPGTDTPEGPGVADVGAVARTAAAMSAPPDAASAVVLDVPPETWVAMEPVRLREVLVNYLSNAAKYAPGQPVTLRARQDGGEVVCEVIDQGPGVPDTLKLRVFEKGYRLPESDVRAEGHGLGLSVVRNLVRTAGGRCGVSDNPEGTGAVFWVRLPRASGG